MRERKSHFQGKWPIVIKLELYEAVKNVPGDFLIR